MWDEIVGARDMRTALRAHIALAMAQPCAPEWIDRLVEAAVSAELGVFPSTTSLDGQAALKIVFPLLEDGEPIDDDDDDHDDDEDERVALYCGPPFTGPALPSVASSVRLLCSVHNGLAVQKGSDVVALFEGLDADGALLRSPTLDPEGAAVDCLPNGWAWIDEGARRDDGEQPVRWVSEELREARGVLWPGDTTGAVILQTVAAVVLGHTLGSLAVRTPRR